MSPPLNPISRRRLLQRGLASAGALAGVPFLSEPVSAEEKTQPPPTQTVNRDIRTAAGHARLSMLFDGKTAAECRAWQKRFLAKLAELLGEIDPPKRWSTVVEKTTPFADHTRHELLLTSKSAPAVPVYLLVPKGNAAAKRPAVLCVHGHGAYGHHPIVGRTDIPGVAKAIQHAHSDYGLQFVRKGYVVAAPCLIPFGRRLEKDHYGRTDPCATTFVRMQALGQLPIAANLRDLRWCIDLLQRREDVNADKIGCAGLSYGGRMTMLVAAMDERIQVAAVSGALNLLQERIQQRYSCGSQIIPSLLKYGDYSEIGSLIAPRPSVWETGSRDSLIVPRWDGLFRRRLHRAYAAYGRTDQLKYDRFQGGHRWNGEVAYPLFAKVLK